MKNIVPYKLFESDDDIYTTIVDILADVTDDGFDIFGLDGLSDKDYFRRFNDFNLEIGKRTRDSIPGGYRYEKFKLSEIRNSINHLTSYLKSKGFVYGVTIKFPNRSESELIVAPMANPIGKGWKERKAAYEGGYYDDKEIKNIFLSFRKNTGGSKPLFGYNESFMNRKTIEEIDRNVQALEQVDDDMVEDILSEIRDENLSAKYQKDIDSHSPDICVKIFPGNHLYDVEALDKTFKYDVVENSLKHLASYMQEFELTPSHINVEYSKLDKQGLCIGDDDSCDHRHNYISSLKSIDEIDRNRNIRLIVIRFNKK